MRGDLFGVVMRRALHPAWEAGVRGRPTLRYLAELERSQYRPLDELEAMQAGALAVLLRHAYQHVPWYRDRMRAAGVSPADVRGPADIGKLPLLSRSDARESGEQRVSTAPPLPSIRKSTSGTMGQPLSFGYDLDSEYWRGAVRMRGYGWAGYQMGDSAVHYWGAAASPPHFWQRQKVALDRALKREVYINCTLRGDGELRAAAELIGRARPDVLLCFAQAGGDLARFINEHGLRRWDSISVICGAERVLDADRKALEAAFGPVFETYGSREVMLIGAECERHDGLHLSAENLIVEVLVDGRPAQPGEVGEVVITDLHNRGMPFIRYVNGDLATQLAPAPCACGRTLPRLGPVEGRVTETLRDGSGGRVSGLVFNVMFASLLASRVKQFQVVQHADRSITLRLVPSAPIDEAADRQIRETCRAYLKGVEVRTQLVDDIPPGKSGKRQVVIVEGPG